MRILSRLSITVLALLCISPLFAQNSNNGSIRNISVYGDEDRKDYFEVDRTMKAFADSTVALFRDEDLFFDKTNNVYRMIRWIKLGIKRNLKKSERFYDQPSASQCSGALVGDDMIFTAGHCAVGYMACRNIKIVFGYAVKKKNFFPTSFSAENVYSCKERIAYSDDGSRDYALLRLDRKVSGHTPLAINRDQNLKVGTKLFVIGYPNGLPVKIAGNAEIRSVHNDYFAANLDTFRGNSGSPVFNAETYLIEGILVDGVGDYRYGYFGGMVDPKNPHNYKPGTTMKYENDNGREKAAKISLIEAFIPVTELETAIMETRKKDINIGKTGDIQSIQGQYQGETEFVPAIYYPEPEPEKTNVYKI